MVIRNADMRRYIHEVRKELPVAGKGRMVIVRQIQAVCKSYLAENPSAAYEDLITRFGTPGQIAATYLEELDVADLKKKLTVKKRVVCAAVIAAIAALGIWTGVVLHALNEYGDAMPGYIEKTVEVFERVPAEGE